MILQDKFYKTMSAILPDQERKSPSVLFNKITILYSDPCRHYHTLEHIQDLLIKLEENQKALMLWPNEINALELAIWYHDAIYEPHKKNNELQSAIFFHDEITQYTGTGYELVENLIMSTNMELKSKNYLEHIMRDLDMSILGAEKSKYNQYKEGVRKEYEPIYGKGKYRSGRMNFLKQLMDNDIFQIQLFRDKYEDRAKYNVEHEWIEIINS
jgi:predicted metal-dependent HD superfamily phosphohydrolase